MRTSEQTGMGAGGRGNLRGSTFFQATRLQSLKETERQNHPQRKSFYFKTKGTVFASLCDEFGGAATTVISKVG